MMGSTVAVRSAPRLTMVGNGRLYVAFTQRRLAVYFAPFASEVLLVAPPRLPAVAAASPSSRSGGSALAVGSLGEPPLRRRAPATMRPRGLRRLLELFELLPVLLYELPCAYLCTAPRPGTMAPAGARPWLRPQGGVLQENPQPHTTSGATLAR